MALSGAAMLSLEASEADGVGSARLGSVLDKLQQGRAGQGGDRGFIEGVGGYGSSPGVDKVLAATCRMWLEPPQRLGTMACCRAPHLALRPSAPASLPW